LKSPDLFAVTLKSKTAVSKTFIGVGKDGLGFFEAVFGLFGGLDVIFEAVFGIFAAGIGDMFEAICGRLAAGIRA
jgi:hypothetical protein